MLTFYDLVEACDSFETISDNLFWTFVVQAGDDGPSVLSPSGTQYIMFY